MSRIFVKRRKQNQIKQKQQQVLQQIPQQWLVTNTSEAQIASHLYQVRTDEQKHQHKQEMKQLQEQKQERKQIDKTDQIDPVILRGRTMSENEWLEHQTYLIGLGRRMMAQIRLGTLGVGSFVIGQWRSIHTGERYCYWFGKLVQVAHDRNRMMSVPRVEVQLIRPSIKPREEVQLIRPSIIPQRNMSSKIPSSSSFEYYHVAPAAGPNNEFDDPFCWYCPQGIMTLNADGTNSTTDHRGGPSARVTDGKWFWQAIPQEAAVLLEVEHFNDDVDQDEQDQQLEEEADYVMN